MKNLYLTALMLSFSVPLLAAHAWADDSAPQIRPATKCFPAKGITKLSEKLGKIPAKHQDVIRPEMRAQFSDGDGRGMPERFFVRDGQTETDLKIEEDGYVSGLTLETAIPKSAELCIQDSKRALPMETEVKLGFSMSVDIAYPKKATYSLGELEEGLEEGRVAYKKMVPGPVSIMVPRLTHVVIGYEEKTPAPNIYATAGGQKTGALTPQPFGKAWVLEVAQIKAVGGDGLLIEDDFKIMEPGTDIETMRKFGFSEAPEDE